MYVDKYTIPKNQFLSMTQLPISLFKNHSKYENTYKFGVVPFKIQAGKLYWCGKNP